MAPQLNDILTLSVPERILWVEAIWDSIASHPTNIELSDEHKKIIDEELAAYKSNPNTGSSWEDVKSRIKAGHK